MYLYVNAYPDYLVVNRVLQTIQNFDGNKISYRKKSYSIKN